MDGDKKSYQCTCGGQAMIYRFFTLLVGFGLAVAGGVSLLAYLNLLTAGYDLHTYFHFIIRRIEFYFLFVGGFLIWVSIYFPTREKRRK